LRTVTRRMNAWAPSLVQTEILMSAQKHAAGKQPPIPARNIVPIRNMVLLTALVAVIIVIMKGLLYALPDNHWRIREFVGCQPLSFCVRFLAACATTDHPGREGDPRALRVALCKRSCWSCAVRQLACTLQGSAALRLKGCFTHN